MRVGLMVFSVVLALAACGDRAEEAGVVDAAGNAAADNAVVGNPAALGNAAVPAAPAVPRTAENGRQYVEMAGAGDLYEIEAARLALEKSRNEDVRSLAEMILTDHQRSTQQLSAAARQADPPLAVRPSLDPQQENDLQALRAAAAGEAFDREYLMQQLRAHEQALGLVTHYAINGDVDALRRHASTASEPIRRHLSRVRDLVLQVS